MLHRYFIFSLVTNFFPKFSELGIISALLLIHLFFPLNFAFFTEFEFLHKWSIWPTVPQWSWGKYCLIHWGLLHTRVYTDPLLPRGSRHLPFTWQQPSPSLSLAVSPAGLPDWSTPSKGAGSRVSCFTGKQFSVGFTFFFFNFQWAIPCLFHFRGSSNMSLCFLRAYGSTYL